MLQLLWDFKDVFARSLDDIKQYPHYELGIELLSNRKIFKRQYRLNSEDTEEVERQINKMSKADIIEPSETVEYNSPVFLVNKRDGSKRLVTDLRPLNAAILPKLVQLSNITELSRFLSVSDLYRGYWQVFLEKSSRPYTSFTSPKTGFRYQYCVAPFGLSTSPAAMLYVLNGIFGGKLKKISFSIF